MNRQRVIPKAFALMELLVVMTIIASLAALLLPALAKSKASAQRAVCTSNLKQVCLGAKMYADDHGQTLPSLVRSNVDLWNGYKSVVKGYVGLAGVSSPHDLVFACPADWFYTTSAKEAYTNSPLHEQARSDFSSYDYNTGNLKKVNGTNLAGIAGLKETAIREPSKTILIGEMPAWICFSWHAPQRASAFNGAMNLTSFVDGHVSYIPFYFDAARTDRATLSYDPPGGYDYRWSAQ